MTGTTETSAGLDLRRRRLLFRAWHRGTREMDLLLGRFADARLRGFDDVQVADFETLIELQDHDLFAWLLGDAPVPPEHDGPVFRDLLAFHRNGPAS